MAENHAHFHRLPQSWPFDDPENLGVLTTVRVLEGQPVMFVSHDEDDGGWQFLCGTTNKAEDARLVCLAAIVEREPRVAELAKLPLGWTARRHEVDGDWHRLRARRRRR